MLESQLPAQWAREHRTFPEETAPFAGALRFQTTAPNSVDQYNGATSQGEGVIEIRERLGGLLKYYHRQAV